MQMVFLPKDKKRLQSIVKQYPGKNALQYAQMLVGDRELARFAEEDIYNYLSAICMTHEDGVEAVFFYRYKGM